MLQIEKFHGDLHKFDAVDYQRNLFIFSNLNLSFLCCYCLHRIELGRNGLSRSTSFFINLVVNCNSFPSIIHSGFVISAYNLEVFVYLCNSG